MKRIVFLLVAALLAHDAASVSMAKLLGHSQPKSRKLAKNDPKNKRKLDKGVVKLHKKQKKSSSKSHKKSDSRINDRFLAQTFKGENKPLPTIQQDISELNNDIKKVHEEQRREKEEEIHKKQELEKQRQAEAARSLKVEIDAQKKAKKESKKERELKERKTLMARFKALDTPDQIDKLKSIYKSYGIKIKDLGNKDLKFLIKNTKRLLKMYYDPSNAMSGFGERSLGDAAAAAGLAQGMVPQQMQQQPSQMQAQQPQYGQQSDPRGLMAISPAMMIAKGASDSIYANRAAGGDMSIKFPDSPPVVVTNQMPYYSN